MSKFRFGLIAALAAFVFSTASAGERFAVKGADFGEGRIESAIVPAKNIAFPEFLSVTVDTNAAAVTFYASAAGVKLTAVEGLAGTCTVASGHAIPSSGVVVSRSLAGTDDYDDDVYERHSVTATGATWVVLSPAPTAVLTTGDVLYAQAADVILPVPVTYQLTSTNGQYAMETHYTIGNGASPLYAGGASRPLLVDLAGATNDSCSINVLSGQRNK